MGKKYLLFATAVAAIAVVSCAKEEAPAADVKAVREQPSLEEITLGGTSEATPRSYISGTSVNWSAGDDIAVYDAVGGDLRAFAISNISGTSASFSGSAAEVETYYAVYPQGAAGGMSSAGVLTATLPTTQMVASGTNTAQGALVCVAQGTKASGLAFKNVFGRLAVTVTRDDVARIVVHGNDIAGTATFNASTGALVAVTSGEDEIELLPPSGSSTFDTGTYYVAVLPGTTPAADFKVSVKSSGLYGAVQLSTKDVAIPRNGGFNFGELDTVNWGIHLFTKAELFAWNDAYDSWTSSDVVYLDKDIDMELDAWSPHSFSGTFEGQNHSLTHLNVPTIGSQHSGFFNTLSGTLRNVTFGADGDGSIIKIPTSGDDNWHYAGVAGDVTGTGSMSYVTNWATIEVTADADVKTRLGGLAGRWNSSGTISHCTNRGAIHNYANTASNNSYIGGLVAVTDADLTISDSDNYGDITVKCPTVMGIGGILGNGNGMNVTIEGCDNHGNISIEDLGSGTAVNHRLGGILCASCTAGTYANAYTTTLNDCHNYGRIESCDGASENSMGGVIGYMTGTASQTISLTDCSNEATAELGMTVTSGSKGAWIGGILAHMPASQTLNITLTRCVNRADLTNIYPLTQDVAGISAYLNSGTTISFDTCKNYGDIKSTAGTGTTNQQLGGIVGRVLATTKTYVDKCENYGNITFDNSSNTVGRQLLSGIVAWANQNFEITDCINDGDVTINTSSSNNYCYAGAIVGYTGNGATIVKDNKAKGAISCNSAAATAAVGGLFGRFNKFKTVSGNEFYGTVSSGGVATVKAGAIIGMLGGAYTIASSTICDAVTVDGVTYASAADAAAWLCPSNSGTVSAPTVNAHSGSEI